MPIRLSVPPETRLNHVNSSSSVMVWDLLGESRSRKRRTATAAEKMLYWDTHAHVCHVCHKKITRISDAELDHVRAYSKGGSTMKLAHRGCNRLKSDKSLGATQRRMGVRSSKRKTKKRRRRRRSSSLWDIGF